MDHALEPLRLRKWSYLQTNNFSILLVFSTLHPNRVRYLPVTSTSPFLTLFFAID